MTDESIAWKPFECDARTFEYVAVPTKLKTQPAGWPAHKPSPGSWEHVVRVIVRKPGEDTGPATAYPEETVITTEHAIETARRFWADLTRYNGSDDVVATDADEQSSSP